MMRILLLVAILLIVVTVRAQRYPCSCSCCIGQGCAVVSYPTVYAQNCTIDSCLEECRTQYYQCQSSPPYGQAISQCFSSGSTSNPFGGQFSCRCNCCNSGSSSCAVTFVGYTTAYLCDTSACSIACHTQYSNVCVSNQFGQTEGTCVGLVTTTTPSTTIGPWLGNGCSCYCCQSAISCSTNFIFVGTTSASQCSSAACTPACQSQYSTLCSLSFGQTNGICTNQTGENTRCQCNCCSTQNGCRDYEVISIGDCSSCYNVCLQQSPCINPYQMTQRCLNNQSTTSITPTSTTNKSPIFPKLSFSIFLSILVVQLVFPNSI